MTALLSPEQRVGGLWTCSERCRESFEVDAYTQRYEMKEWRVQMTCRLSPQPSITTATFIKVRVMNINFTNLTGGTHSSTRDAELALATGAHCGVTFVLRCGLLIAELLWCINYQSRRIVNKPATPRLFSSLIACVSVVRTLDFDRRTFRPTLDLQLTGDNLCG